MPQTWPEDRREAVCEWLRANGVDPDHVPQDADLYLEPAPDGDPYTGRYLHYERFHLNSDGRRHVDERGLSTARERCTTPLLVDPPDWWEPYRKPTRDQLLDAVARVRDLHREEYGCCAHCTRADFVSYPCPTIQAIDGEVKP